MKISKSIIRFIFSIAIMAMAADAFSQGNASARMNIDNDRGNLHYFDKEALVKAKEYIRKDSTYYVGHMFEGAYKYNRAADMMGFKNAIKPLEKARELLVKDYKRKLKVRSGDIMAFIDAYKFQYDYCAIIALLEESYRNIEAPDKALEVLLDLRHRNLQKDFFGDPYTTIAWIYHRSRMHTSEKYSFLGNSLEENNKIALAYLDSAMIKYRKNKYANSQIFPKDFVDSDMFSVYHYKSLLHAYDMQIDSAEHYYMLMKDKDIFPNSNYATFKLTQAEFSSAEEFYKKAQQRDYLDKRIREANYMLSMINIYQGKTKSAMQMLQDMIRAQGSTPGFGWHNIALARAYYYEGLTEESVLTNEKAEHFHELHIGTTWGQEQYEMASGLLKFMNRERLIRSVKFENGDWWYSPGILAELPAQYLRKYTSQFVLVNRFANNPEREHVVYRLFSSECITTFDEIWHMIRDFSPEFFIKTFNKFLDEDKRPKVKKYYRYFIAKYLLEQGETQKAITLFNQVLNDKSLDKENELLLIARIYEALANAYDELDKEWDRDRYILKLYQTYPQLVPFSDLEMKFNLQVETPSNKSEIAIVKQLKNCNIDWEGDRTWPKVTVGFRTNEKKLREMYYTVHSPSGEVIIPFSSIIISQPKDAGKKLAYRLFSIMKP